MFAWQGANMVKENWKLSITRRKCHLYPEKEAPTLIHAYEPTGSQGWRNTGDEYNTGHVLFIYLFIYLFTYLFVG
jgi:hypothetical protein